MILMPTQNFWCYNRRCWNYILSPKTHRGDFLRNFHRNSKHKFGENPLVEFSIDFCRGFKWNSQMKINKENSRNNFRKMPQSSFKENNFVKQNQTNFFNDLSVKLLKTFRGKILSGFQFTLNSKRKYERSPKGICSETFQKYFTVLVKFLAELLKEFSKLSSTKKCLKKLLRIPFVKSLQTLFQKK